MDNENLSFKEYKNLLKNMDQRFQYILSLQEYFFFIFICGILSFLSFTFLKTNRVFFGFIIFISIILLLSLIQKSLIKIFNFLNLFEIKNIIRTIIYYQIFFIQLYFVIILLVSFEIEIYKLIIYFGLVNFFIFFYLFNIFYNREIFIQFLKKENGEIDSKIIGFYFPIKYFKSFYMKKNFKEFFQL